MRDAILLASAVLSLATSLGTLLWVLLRVYGRLVKIELERKLLWGLIADDAKIDARRLQLIMAQSPERLHPRLAEHFRMQGIGERIQTFYQQQGLATMSDADALWALLVQFRDEWQAAVADPLGLNIRESAVAALQFCRDGGA